MMQGGGGIGRLDSMQAIGTKEVPTFSDQMLTLQNDGHYLGL